MSDTSQRADDLIALLNHESAHAFTRRIAATALGITVNQLNYLLRTNAEASEAWERARAKIKSDRCATRRCNMCRIVKSAIEFPVDRRDGCGIGRRCLVCNRLAVKLYRQRQTT